MCVFELCQSPIKIFIHFVVTECCVLVVKPVVNVIISTTVVFTLLHISVCECVLQLLHIIVCAHQCLCAGWWLCGVTGVWCYRCVVWRVRGLTGVRSDVCVVWRECGVIDVWCDGCVVWRVCGVIDMWCDGCVVWWVCGVTGVWCYRCVVWQVCGVMGVVWWVCGVMGVWCDRCMVWQVCGLMGVWSDIMVVNEQVYQQKWIIITNCIHWSHCQQTHCTSPTRLVTRRVSIRLSIRRTDWHIVYVEFMVSQSQTLYVTFILETVGVNAHIWQESITWVVVLILIHCLWWWWCSEGPGLIRTPLCVMTRVGAVSLQFYD